jgi:alcohol dehydrogenase
LDISDIVRSTTVGAFDWLAPARIFFGAGRSRDLGKLASGLGSRACVVTGGQSLKASGRLEQFLHQLDVAGVEWVHPRVEGEPTVEAVDEIVASLGKFRADMVIAIGGGSALDAGKAVAALLANSGSALDYLEGVGKGKPVARPSRPLIAVPTTAGTGSEATKNAVLSDAARAFKRSMRGDGMMPSVAVIDPELTYDCPPAVTAACGMDALTQLIEAFVSRRANPMSDLLALKGLALCRALEGLAASSSSSAAADGDAERRNALRADMCLAAFLGGMCLSNVGLGAVHGLASPLGAFSPIPHGAGCAALLPAVIRANVRRAGPEADAAMLAKLATVLALLADDPSVFKVAAAGDSQCVLAFALADCLADLNRKLGLPGLEHYGVTREDFPRIVAGARGASMKTNPVELDDAELAKILEEAL